MVRGVSNEETRLLVEIIRPAEGRHVYIGRRVEMQGYFDPSKPLDKTFVREIPGEVYVVDFGSARLHAGDHPLPLHLICVAHNWGTAINGFPVYATSGATFLLPRPDENLSLL